MSFRNSLKTLAVLCLAPGFFALSVLPSGAAPTVVATESFDYASGSLIGRNGGSGWSAAWTKFYGAGGDMVVNTTGFTYTGLTTSGGKTAWGSGGNEISQAERTLPLMNAGIVYIQFLSQLESGSSGGGTPQMRLNNNSTVTGALGGNGGTYAAKMSILNASLQAKADGTSSTTANLNALNFVVVRIDYTANETKMWVNPTLATFDYDNPPAANATYAGLAPVFNSIGLYTRSPGSFDEITIMQTTATTAPTDIALSASSISENNAANATVGTLSTTDSTSGDTFTYSLVSGTGDTDNASFSISGNALRLTPVADYETKSSYSVRIRTTDAGSEFFEKQFTITITNVNEAPTISDIADQTINEDGTTGALAFTISDPETAAGSLTVTRASSNTTLVPLANVVLGGSGASRTVTVTPAADASGTATITITFSDGTLSTNDTFVLTVNAVNDAPALSSGTSQLAYETVNPVRSSNNIVYSVNNAATLSGTSFSRVRYRMQTRVSGTLYYADTTFDAWSGLTVAGLAVPTPNNAFVIQRNVTNLTVESNYPGVVNATSQTGRLEIWDRNYATAASSGVGGNGGTYDFDDTPQVGTYGSFQVHNLSVSPGQTVLAWNNHGVASPDVGFGNRPTSHPDWTFAGASSLGTTDWKLQIYIGTDGIPATYAFTEDVAGDLVMPGTPFVDVDSSTLTVTLSIADGTITANAGTGITLGGSATARTFSGTVADLNTYFTTAGKVSYLGPLNNTTSRTLTISAFDGTDTTQTTATINFTPANDNPTDLALSASSIAENNAANATVGTLSTSDVDSGDTFTYTLVSGTGDTDNASFTISGSALRLTPVADYETKSSYSVRIRSTDSGALSFEKQFTISVTDVNESPADLALSSNAIADNSPANSTVGTLTTTDQDAGESFTYTLVSGTGSTDNAAFNISGASLRLTGVADVDAQSSYSVRIRTTDSGGLFFERSFAVTVTAPEVSVTESALAILPGGSKDFGPVATGSNTSRTFTITNSGSGNLTSVGLTIDGAHASNFTVSAAPAATVSASGGQTTFTITFSPTAFGTRTAAVHISSNDDGSPFTINLTGKGGAAAAALAFDGAGDTIEIAAHADFNTPTFTIEAWVKPNSTMPQWARVWGTENNQGDLIAKTGSENRFSFAPVIDGEFAYLTAPTTWTSGQWYHVAGVVDHLMVRLFINGVQVASCPKTSAWQGDSGKRLIGNCTAPATSNRFKGTIDEVRYWNHARNCDQISQARSGELTGAESGLVAYYNFNQGVAACDNSGITTALDATGNGHNATLSNFSLADGNITSNWVTPGAVASGVLAPTPQYAELDVEGNGVVILDGDTTPHEEDHTDFGDNASPAARNFTLHNTGNIDLNVTDISLSGDDAAEFEIGGIAFPAVIAGGASATFTVSTEANPLVCRRATVTVTCDDCDEGVYDFAIQSAPPITITTAGTSLIISDSAAAGGMLTLSEPSAGAIQFTHTTRAFAVNGGARQFGSSGTLSLTGITAVSLTAGGGDDDIRLAAFSAALPSLTIDSGTGNDTLRAEDDITFAANASLSATVNGSVTIAEDAELTVSGSGSLSIEASQNVKVLAGACLQSGNGALSVVANAQSTPATGNFAGVLVTGGTIEAAGSGDVTVRGRGGDASSGFQTGVRIVSGGQVRCATGSLTVAGTGGDSTGNSNYGVHLSGATSAILSAGSYATVDGLEGGGPSGTGIVVDGGATITSTASAATLRLSANSMHLPNAAISTAADGFVLVTPATASAGINLGLVTNPIGGPLALTDFELDGISTGNLTIATDGPVIQSTPISRAALTKLHLKSNLSTVTLNGGPISSAGGDMRLESAAGVSAPGAGMNIDAGAGLASFDASKLTFAINGIAANTGYQQLNIAGRVDLSGASLDLTGSHVPAKGQSFILINNDGTDAIEGTFAGYAEGSTVTFNGVPLIISYAGGTGNDVILSFAAPTLTLARASIICNEGATATNNGTLLDLQGNVSLTANAGSATNNGDGTWSWAYTPADGPDATGTVTITATDDSTPPLTTSVNFALTVKNVTPIAQAQTVSVAEDSAATPITLGVLEPGADTLTYTIVSAPPASRGSLSPISGNTVQFTPAPDFAGVTNFTFQATDSDGAVSNVAAVTINVISSDDPPSFVIGGNKVHPTGTTTAQSFTAWATAINDGDADLTQTVSFTVTEVGDSGLFTTAPAISSTGVLTYRPSGASGAATLSVILTDSGGMSSPAQTFTITVAAFSPGTYTGLVAPGSEAPTRDTTGLFSGTLTAKGSLSGKVNFAGVTSSFTALFDLGTGNATGSGPTLTWNLHLDVLGGTDKITGTIGRLSGGLLTAVCDVDADRATFSTTNRVPNQFLNSASSGLYTLAFASKEQSPPLDLSTYPQGDGFGKATVSASGAVTFAGTLADGTAVTASAPLSKTFQWPLAVLIKQTTLVPGATLAGMIQFDTTQPDSDLSAADVVWFRGALPAAKNYASGWPAGVAVDAVGALYSTTTNLQTTLAVTTNEGPDGGALLSLAEGKLMEAISHPLKVTANVITKTTAASTYTLTAAPTAGTFTGTFTPNWANTNTTKPTFKGIFIQKGASKGGYGFFLSNIKSDTAPESGRVLLATP